MLDALERASPESKSKAIYALQEALQVQADLIEACMPVYKTFNGGVQYTPREIERIAIVMKRYYKV